MTTSNQAVRRLAPPSSRSVAPASTPPSAPHPAATDTWAAIQAIQNTLNGLIAQVTAPGGAAVVEKSQAQVQNETQRKLLSTLKANLQPHPILTDGAPGMWLTDLAQLAGIEKGVAHTQARKMNYRNRIGLSLEKDERIGKSAFWVTVR